MGSTGGAGSGPGGGDGGSTGPGRNFITLYSVATLARMWECSRWHIYDLIARGELASVQLGIGRAKTRITAAAAETYIARKTRKGRAA